MADLAAEILVVVEQGEIGKGFKRMPKQLTYHKDKLSKLLLAVALFFSLFSLSGYAGNSQLQQEKTIQTELVFSTKCKIARRTVSYKKSIGFTYTLLSFLNKDIASEINALLAYNSLVKVHFDAVSKQFYFITPGCHFLSLKTIPQNSKEDVFSSVLL